MTQQILCGNNIELLRQYPDNYFDSIVTDPPYGLGKEPNAVELMKDWVEHGYHEVGGKGFMGKEWDAFVPQPLFWKEAFRVLKHGGHVLSFFGTRTYDWGVMAMRFAGFEVRDTITWHYGSGFPKSHNISKAIDKMPIANSRLYEFAELLKEKRSELGLSISDADALICNGSTMYNFLEGRNIDGVIKVYPPNKDSYEKIKNNFGIIGWDDIIENNLKVIGSEFGNYGFQKDGERWEEETDIKVHTTDAAKQWEGWGSAIKPASEPIVLARKPLEKGLSIAENVLKYGTGGINIDGCRIGKKEGDRTEYGVNGIVRSNDNNVFGKQYGKIEFDGTQGRFPANVIFSHHSDCERVGFKNIGTGEAKNHKDGEVSNAADGYKRPNKSNFTHKDSSVIAAYVMEEVEDWNCVDGCPIKELDEQSGVSKSSASIRNNKNRNDKNIYGNGKGIPQMQLLSNHSDKGGASRFFYTAKASKSERNKGLEGFEEKPLAFSNQAKAELKRGNTEFDGNGIKGDGIVGHGNSIKMIQNIHPTVKPVALMRYLVRLITPPNGIVLDPFNGSGTTGIAAKLEGFNYVGLELDKEYCKIAEARIQAWEIEQPAKQKKTTKKVSGSNPNELLLF